MTYKEALEVLIRSASRDIRGTGLGYRDTTDEWRSKVKEAITIVFPKVYGRKINDADKFNLF